jgi:hypothetical protein
MERTLGGKEGAAMRFVVREPLDQVAGAARLEIDHVELGQRLCHVWLEGAVTPAGLRMMAALMMSVAHTMEMAPEMAPEKAGKES